MSGVVGRSSEVPFFSTVTGGVVDGEELGSGYWYRNLRSQVRFEETVRVLLDEGFRHFIEVSPHPVHTTGIEQIAEDQGVDVCAVGTLRRAEGGTSRLLNSLAEAYVTGVPVEWARAYAGTGARRVELPTYAFQRRRYWLGTGSPVDAAATGMDVVAHPLLDAGVPLPDSDGHVFTGRWSVPAQPWLADHAVRGRTVAPGTALVEAILRAGDGLGCDRLDELSLESPVVLPDDGGAVRVQVAVMGPEGNDGRRAVSVHTCGADGMWTRRARGSLLATTGVQEEPVGLVSWPPVGARAVDTAGLYERLADEGLVYGPAFRGLGAVWRGGDGEVFAEVALPDVAESAETGAVRRDTSGFGIHPALLDGALHAWLACADDSGSGTVRLPFLWTGVSLYATGATMLRVRLTPLTGGGMSVLVADETGRPVASAEALVTRPLEKDAIGRAAGIDDALHRVEWAPVLALPDGPATEAAVARIAVVGTDELGLGRLAGRYEDLAALAGKAAAGECTLPEYVLVGVAPSPGADVAPEAMSAAGRALALIQHWLADETFAAVGARLVVVTRGAVAVEGGERVDGLSASPVWGLVRSAQTEHPGRFVLLDLDDDDSSLAALPAALGTGEPQLALRRGETSIPRVSALPDLPAIPDGPWQLRTTPEAGLEGLAPVPSDTGNRLLGEFEVRVDVRAAGVNFRDVLVVLGVYPGAE
ncbi:polyketide synthase dehydratase domain-containing protein, partial [Streptomyces javensis]|uniref:polyketide synthase dehydratase domain-containing protein n=1 Tax=Streptomyces javensis TaxID=114698 RepID=UPI003404ECA0